VRQSSGFEAQSRDGKGGLPPRRPMIPAMDRAQRVITVIGLVAIVVTGAFPPWVTFTNTNPAVTVPAGLHFILRPPPIWHVFNDSFRLGGSSSSVMHTARIDYAGLIVEWVVILALVGIAMIAVPRPSR